jgi:threonine synthase
MITVTDPNIHNIALAGAFDDCQEVVKKLFVDHPFRTTVSLAAVNSINWARIMAQITYYVYSWLKVMPAGSSDKISFTVPTGNFGDILAGYYAKEMGLPVQDLIVATNENDILHRFFESGDYSKNGVNETLSPSMDIQISSNFERFLYHQGGNDAAACKTLMDRFDSKGTLDPPKQLLANCQSVMGSERVDNADTLKEIDQVFKAKDGYCLDPHSAIATAAARRHLAKVPNTPMVALCCAHWAKFSPVVEKAIGKDECSKLVGASFPKELSALTSLPTRVKPLPNDVAAVKSFIETTLKERQA